MRNSFDPLYRVPSEISTVSKHNTGASQDSRVRGFYRANPRGNPAPGGGNPPTRRRRITATSRRVKRRRTVSKTQQPLPACAVYFLGRPAGIAQPNTSTPSAPTGEAKRAGGRVRPPDGGLRSDG